MKIVLTTRGLPILALFLTTAAAAFATPCGTVASPLSCSITQGSVTYTATAFTFVTANASGGGFTYQGGDINIDIASGGGLTGLFTFSKNPTGPNTGVVFFVNPSDAASFTFSYNLTISPAAPGSVAYTSTTNSFNETHTNNALASIQEVAGATSCLAFTGSTSTTCALPGGTTFSVGETVSLHGNTGNTGITSFSALFDANFTPGAAVPEPSSLALLGLGLVALRLMRR